MSTDKKAAPIPIPVKKAPAAQPQPIPQAAKPQPVKTQAVKPQAAPVQVAEDAASEGFVGGFKQWLFYEAPSWMVSMLVHMVIFLILALVMGGVSQVVPKGDAPSFQAADDTVIPEANLDQPFELGKSQVDATELNTESLEMKKYDPVAQEAEYNNNNPDFEKKGGGTVSPTDTAYGGGDGFDINASGIGPIAKNGGGLATGGGDGNNTGHGGTGSGFGGRGQGRRDAIQGGGTKDTERAVGAALYWLARHQDKEGSWAIAHDVNCKGGVKCSGNGGQFQSITAATALGLLPFLAAGQTHQSKGPYQKNILAGLTFLTKNQKPNGALARTEANRNEFYEHGLATIALCEAFGMTNDSRVGAAAQGAINYIEASQGESGGWRYKPNPEDTDTSVVGWQIMALKSGMMAGLKVNQEKLKKAGTDLKRAASGYKGGKYGYIPRTGASPSCTAIGLLCAQYLGANRADAGLGEGSNYLMQNLPDKEGTRNIYYWYYATQVMHNMPGDDWEKWNRKMRRVLVETQEHGGCKEGSWDPDGDAWGDHGGRLFTTSLSCLTLEIYYRYLPLYKTETKENDKKAAAATESEVKKGESVALKN